MQHGPTGRTCPQRLDSFQKSRQHESYNIKHCVTPFHHRGKIDTKGKIEFERRGAGFG